MLKVSTQNTKLSRLLRYSNQTRTQWRASHADRLLGSNKQFLRYHVLGKQIVRPKPGIRRGESFLVPRAKYRGMSDLSKSRAVGTWGHGLRLPPHILADTLTLFQSGEPFPPNYNSHPPTPFGLSDLPTALLSNGLMSEDSATQ